MNKVDLNKRSALMIQLYLLKNEEGIIKVKGMNMNKDDYIFLKGCIRMSVCLDAMAWLCL